METPEEGGEDDSTQYPAGPREDEEMAKYARNIRVLPTRNRTRRRKNVAVMEDMQTASREEDIVAGSSFISAINSYNTSRENSTQKVPHTTAYTVYFI